jgi:hypothetical protein
MRHIRREPAGPCRRPWRMAAAGSSAGAAKVAEMPRFGTCGLAILVGLAAGAAATSPFGQARALPGVEPSMTRGWRAVGESASLASKRDIEKFLAERLPMATAANPKYRSAAGDVETQWLTKTVTFAPDGNSNGTTVSMSEDVREFRNGGRSATFGHETAFLLEDVEISERKDSTDVSEGGEAALGVIFRCRTGKCIRSVYNGDPSSVDWTDIYIQDATSRGMILQAFQALKRMSGRRPATEDVRSP